MERCEDCLYYGDERNAGFVDHCFNEEISEQEHDRVRNNGGEQCEGFGNIQDRSKIKDESINDWDSEVRS